MGRRKKKKHESYVQVKVGTRALFKTDACIFRCVEVKEDKAVFCTQYFYFLISFAIYILDTPFKK